MSPPPLRQFESSIEFYSPCQNLALTQIHHQVFKNVQTWSSSINYASFMPYEVFKSSIFHWDISLTKKSSRYFCSLWESAHSSFLSPGNRILVKRQKRDLPADHRPFTYLTSFFFFFLIFKISFLLLTLGFFISSFSSCFKCRVRLFIWLFSCFLRCACIAMNFPLRTAFIVYLFIFIFFF